MAIFKILEGPSSRIDLKITPFHKGWAYFTPEDGGLYIDTEINGEQKRIRVSTVGGGSTPIYATLLGSGWSNDKQTIVVPGVTAGSNGVIGVTQSITDQQMRSAKNAELYICGQDNGTVTIAAFGEAPAIDIPVAIILAG